MIQIFIEFFYLITAQGPILFSNLNCTPLFNAPVAVLAGALCISVYFS